MIAAAMLCSCATAEITDPQYGTWKCKKGDPQKGEPAQTMTYIAQDGTKTGDIYSTTGFIGDGAIVAMCLEFNNSGECVKDKWGFIRKDGSLAPTLGMYQYSSFQFFGGFPSQINSKYNSSVRMWKEYNHISKPELSFEDNRVLFYSPEKDRFGFMNTNGDIVIEPVFLAAFDFNEHKAVVIDEAKHWGTVNVDGNFTPDPISCISYIEKYGITFIAHDEALTDYRQDQRYHYGEKTMHVSRELQNMPEVVPTEGHGCSGQRNLGLIGKDDIMLIEPKYEALRYIGSSNTASSYFCAKLDSKWGIISTTRQTMTEFIFDDCNPADMNVIITAKNGKYGLVYKGIEIYAPAYDSISSFDDQGKAIALRNGTEVYVFLDEMKEKRHHELKNVKPSDPHTRSTTTTTNTKTK